MTLCRLVASQPVLFRRFGHWKCYFPENRGIWLLEIYFLFTFLRKLNFTHIVSMLPPQEYRTCFVEAVWVVMEKESSLFVLQQSKKWWLNLILGSSLKCSMRILDHSCAEYTFTLRIWYHRTFFCYFYNWSEIPRPHFGWSLNLSH